MVVAVDDAVDQLVWADEEDEGTININNNNNNYTQVTCYYSYSF